MMMLISLMITKPALNHLNLWNNFEKKLDYSQFFLQTLRILSYIFSDQSCTRTLPSVWIRVTDFWNSNKLMTGENCRFYICNKYKHKYNRYFFGYSNFHILSINILRRRKLNVANNNFSLCKLLWINSLRNQFFQFELKSYKLLIFE